VATGWTISYIPIINALSMTSCLTSSSVGRDFPGHSSCDDKIGSEHVTTREDSSHESDSGITDWINDNKSIQNLDWS